MQTKSEPKVTERPIAREQVLRILADADRESEYDDAQDYYLCADSTGREWIQEWGQELPLIENNTSTSWA